MPLTSHALTLTDTVKAELGISGASLDAVIERLINAASEEIERVAGGRHFERVTNQQDMVELRGSTKLVLPRAPIVSISAIAELDIQGNVSTTYASTGYRVDDSLTGIVERPEGWESTAQLAWGVRGHLLPGSERPSIRVTYTAGWITPWQADANYPGGAVGTRDLPYPLEQACIEAASHLYARRGGSSAIKSEKLGDASVTYQDVDAETGSWLPPGALTVAKAHRRTL